MSALLKFIPFLQKTRDWLYVGTGSVSSAATISFPTTALAGDLAIVVYVHSDGSESLPSGYSWIYSGDFTPRHCYKVCAGGESSVDKPNTGGGGGAVILVRPVGGTAFLAHSYFDAPPATRSVTAYTLSKSLIVGACATAADVDASLSTPGSYTTRVSYRTEGGRATSLHAGTNIVDPGTVANYTLDLPYGTPRQVIGVFGVL